MLLRKIMTILFVISTPLKSSIAAEFSYQYGAKKYVVTYGKKAIGFKTEDIELEFESAPCFEKHFSELTLLIENLVQNQREKKSSAGDISLDYKGKNYALSSQSSHGQRVLQLPRTFIQYKLMEKEICKK